MSAASYSNLASALPEGTGLCVINLDERTDRWEDFQKRIIPYFEGVPIERVSATKGVELPGYGEKPLFRGKKRDKTWGARGGCVLSHRDALKIAQTKNWSHVLVLEDDVCFAGSGDEGFCKQLKSGINSLSPDVCYFGFTDPVPPFRTEIKLSHGKAIHRVYGCNTGHAYLVKREAISLILSRLPDRAGIWKWLTRHRAVDRFYYRNLSPALTVMAISPPILEQMEGWSDIMGKTVSAHESGHVTEVPADTALSGNFEGALKKQAKSFQLEGYYDACRGFLKYLRGF